MFKFLDYLCEIITKISAILLALMSLFVFTMAICRNFFSFTPAWIEEFTRYALVWMAMLGASVLTWQDEHLALDIFSSWMPPKANTFIKLPIYLTVATLAIYLTYLSWNAAVREMATKSTVMSIQMFWVYLALPCSFFLMAFFSITLFFKTLITFFSKKNLAG